jgi:SagB-type dehydrogenase family enzyme
VSFRAAFPLAWTFHRNTSRWPHNAAPPPDVDSTPDAPKEYPDAPTVALPEPRPPAAALTTTLAERVSCRRFDAAPVTLEQLATVLDAAYGMFGAISVGQLEQPERPVPSAGGLYPLELYVIARAVDGVEGGVYHLHPVTRLLERVLDAPVPSRMVSQLFLGQPYAGEAAAVIVLTAVLARSLKKYGDRGYRYVLFEAGHVAQNVNLTATALGLGTCNFGGFFDDDVAAVLGVDPDEEAPLYGIALGRPTSADRAESRLPTGEDSPAPS